MQVINARGGGWGGREKSRKVVTVGSSKSPSYQIRCERKQSWGSGEALLSFSAGWGRRRPRREPGGAGGTPGTPGGH